LAKVNGEIALACPAFPANRRTVYQGNLFVGEMPLSESPMKDHPLTPMRDSNLVRVLQRQTQFKVGLVPYATVEVGAEAISRALDKARSDGARFAIVDAVNDRHLIEMGTAAADHPLITGGSGIAMGLPANFVRKGLLNPVEGPRRLAGEKGRAAILAGSCSEATRGQVRTAVAAGIPAFKVDPLPIAADKLSAHDIVGWAMKQSADRPLLVYSSDDPVNVREVQASLGREQAGAMIERVLADVAVSLSQKGFSRLIVAGGETSGAIVTALGVKAIEIGPEIDPGVPWTKSLDDRGLLLALKSGNFGAPDFFLKAWGLVG
jgi:uncharacterized protein YgbK (DUF1537 family)